MKKLISKDQKSELENFVSLLIGELNDKITRNKIRMKLQRMFELKFKDTSTPELIYSGGSSYEAQCRTSKIVTLITVK